MYGLEALSFNVKDGYVGESRALINCNSALLPYQGRWVSTTALMLKPCTPLLSQIC